MDANPFTDRVVNKQGVFLLLFFLPPHPFFKRRDVSETFKLRGSEDT